MSPGPLSILGSLQLKSGMSARSVSHHEVMGCFDEIHAGTRCGQTKALGRRNSFVVGDVVHLVPSLTVAQAEANEEAVADAATDFQIAAPEGGFLTVRDSVLTSWDDYYDASLPLYGYYGHPLDPAKLNPDGTLPESYLWWDAEMAAFNASQHEEMDAEVDKLLDEIFGNPPLAGLSPRSDLVEIVKWLEAPSLFDDEERRTFQGLPGDCPKCAALRDGTIQEYRAQQRYEREQARAAFRKRRHLD